MLQQQTNSFYFGLWQIELFRESSIMQALVGTTALLIVLVPSLHSDSDGSSEIITITD